MVVGGRGVECVPVKGGVGLVGVLVLVVEEVRVRGRGSGGSGGSGGLRVCRRIGSEDGLGPEIQLLLSYSELVGRDACRRPFPTQTHDRRGRVAAALRRDVGAGTSRVVQSFDYVAPIVAH